MQDLISKYQKEQENNARLQSDVDRLKAYYEQELAKLNSKQPQSEVSFSFLIKYIIKYIFRNFYSSSLLIIVSVFNRNKHTN